MAETFILRIPENKLAALRAGTKGSRSCAAKDDPTATAVVDRAKGKGL